MPDPVSRFTNPSTATTYRLVMETGLWRITKAREDDDRLRLAHLRGQPGHEDVDEIAVAHVVAGLGGMSATASDPAETFAAVVVRDMECTADALTAIARDAYEVCEAGCRGFRPRSPVLKQQRDVAMAKAVAECRKMAEAWRASACQTARLPEWLQAALADKPSSPAKTEPTCNPSCRRPSSSWRGP